MAKRREISAKYRMEVTALESCDKCFGTGICIEQEPQGILRQINLSVCMCVRVLPRLTSDPTTRNDPFEKEEPK